MTIRRLAFTHVLFVGGGVQARSVDTATHEIRQFGPGYLCIPKNNRKVGYLVHASLAVPELDLSAEEDEEKPAKKGKAA
ncbi:MAG: hypothetical protein LC640_09245 [Frankia sp.]|nr:hypothetical protein [Frankia sp.]